MLVEVVLDSLHNMDHLDSLDRQIPGVERLGFLASDMGAAYSEGHSNSKQVGFGRRSGCLLGVGEKLQEEANLHAQVHQTGLP